MWDSSEGLELFSKIATWVAAILGFLAGIAALLAVVATSRAETLRESLKRTPPKLDARLAFFRDGQLHFVIDSETMVPFEFQSKVVTRNDIIVSGIPLDWTEVRPTHQRRRFNGTISLQESRVVDQFIELRLDYRSKYEAEILDAALHGRITRAYRVDFGSKTLEPL